MFYHISAPKNRKSILKRGLLPKNGERSQRYSTYEKRVYLIRDPQGIDRLVKHWDWKTHPDFKEGFDIYKISDQVEVLPDEKFVFGFYTQKKLTNIQYLYTIENK